MIRFRMMKVNLICMLLLLGLAACSPSEDTSTVASAPETTEPEATAEPTATPNVTPRPTAVPTEAIQQSAAVTMADATAKLRLMVQEGSKVEFVGYKQTASHTGAFNDLWGTINIVPDEIEKSTINVEIRLNSLQTDEDRLTGHLKSPAFFNTEIMPVARFISSKIESTDRGLNITGILDLHGFKKELTFPATFELENRTLNANAKFSLNRQDFGISYPGNPHDPIKDDVDVTLTIVAAPGGTTR